jgi:hypothetical protein
MQFKANLVLCSLIFLIIGVELAGYGSALLLIQPQSQSTSNQTSEAPVGFVFGNSENLTQEATYFWLHLENVDCKAGTINAELDMQVECQKVKNPHPFYSEKSVFFLLQVPSNISNVKVDYHMRDKDPQFYGGTFQTINGTVSAILVEIPKENFTFGEQEFLCFYFEMSNVFKVDSYTYQRAITFSNNFDDAIRESIWQRHIVADNTAVIRLLYKAELYVEQPNDFTLAQIMPVPRGIHYYSNHTQYSWDLKAISTSLGSDSIILCFEDIAAKNTIAKHESFGWFLLGFGIPLGISSFFELQKTKKKMAFNIREKKTQKSLLTLILFAIAIFLILHFLAPIPV